MEKEWLEDCAQQAGRPVLGKERRSCPAEKGRARTGQTGVRASPFDPFGYAQGRLSLRAGSVAAKRVTTEAAEGNSGGRWVGEPWSQGMQEGDSRD